MHLPAQPTLQMPELLPRVCWRSGMRLWKSSGKWIKRRFRNAPLLLALAKSAWLCFAIHLMLCLKLSSSIFWQTMCRFMPFVEPAGFLIDDFRSLIVILIRGFVLNNIAYDGAEAAVNGYMQLYQPQFALVELLNGREVEVTAFRANNGNPLSLWLLDLPGVTVDSSSLFINNVQAEKLRNVG
jgi:hypothetical protein